MYRGGEPLSNSRRKMKSLGKDRHPIRRAQEGEEEPAGKWLAKRWQQIRTNYS